MKISSLQENLKTGLFMVSHIAGKNVNLPILNNILIKAENGNIKLVSTDLEVGITTTVRGKIEEEGIFTVDSKILNDYVALLPNKKIDIVKNNLKLELKCDNYQTTIKGQEAEEYPLIPQIEKNEHYKVKIDDFKKAISQVIFAVSTSEVKIELSGVLFSFTSEKLILASTDSFRLAEKEINLKTNNNEEKKIIIPAKTLQEVLRILSSLKNEELKDGEDEITFYISDNQVLFILGNTELVSRLIEGQYPDYKQIIPIKPKTKTIINKSEFSRAVKAASLFSKSGVNDINLDFPSGKNKIIITSVSGQSGENTTELDAKVEGSDNGIVVNFKYLLDGINNIDGENILIEITDGDTPCVLKNEDNDLYTYIIMPIKQ